MNPLVIEFETVGIAAIVVDFGTRRGDGIFGGNAPTSEIYGCGHN
jgi:hypothetical protein